VELVTSIFLETCIRIQKDVYKLWFQFD